MRSTDWAATPLGPVDGWPQSLRTTLSILLTSRAPIFLWWGTDLIQFYNDAYRPILGSRKHLRALGQPGRQTWDEIWYIIGPMIEHVFAGGSTAVEDGLLVLNRNGYLEEGYFNYAYSPIRGEFGAVQGVFCVCGETTAKVIGERRLRTLKEMATRAQRADTVDEACRVAAETLALNPQDLPFGALYLYSPDRAEARLAGVCGLPEGHAVSPAIIRVSDPDETWAFVDLAREPRPERLDLSAHAATLPTPVWPDAPVEAQFLPITLTGDSLPAGFAVLGASTRRRLDNEYCGFLSLVVSHIGSAIAESRAFERERQRVEELAELDRAKTAFFSNVSHEFRTPLTLLLGPLEDLKTELKSILPPAKQELLAVAHRNALRLQRLVNTLLDFARIEAGRVEAYYEATDLSTLTADLAACFRSVMERAGLQYEVHCPPLPDLVHVDREMWEKIVLNLLSNAFKYTERGAVTLRLTASGGKAQLFVGDTGIGISDQELSHVFERFHRVEGSRGRTQEGSGIGLAFVNELVKLHGGQAEVSSVLGEGSTFVISIPLGSSHLPAGRIGGEQRRPVSPRNAETYVDEALRWVPDETKPKDRAPKAGQPGKRPRHRVLVADDNADMRDYMRRLLEERYEVTAVANGDEALDAALADPPDLVLSDVMMPVRDGFGLISELRTHERTKTLPVILLSARAGEEAHVEGLNSGADDYVVKPFTARELLARVEAHLSLAHLRREAHQARRLSETRLDLALEVADMLAWEWNPGSDALAATGSLARVFGRDIRSYADVLELVHPEDLDAHRALASKVSGEGGSWAAQFRILRADNREVAWLEERATSVADEKGQIACVVGVVCDVTARKLAEQELKRRNEDLARVNSELEEFAYVASHDLQEPLRTVNIYTELLLRRVGLQEDEIATSFAAFVHGGVEKMESLIQDLLAYAQVVHREQESAGASDLNRSLESAVRTLRGLILETGASVTSDRLPTVVGEEAQLGQVFQNLISNALKYRRADVIPTVHIGAHRMGDEWVVSVTDNGIGFEPKYARRIFGLFKRLHKTAYPGTGLGLAICKRVIERYGGQIEAASDGEGKGASFSFTLKSIQG